MMAPNVEKLIAEQSPNAQRIQLNMETGYCNSWKAADGVREFVQNWWDASAARLLCGDANVVAEHDAEGGMLFRAVVTSSGEESGSIKWKLDESLCLQNKGVIEQQALALGNTTKREHDAFLGGHGEGLKVGALALVRSGHTVVIDTGAQQSWLFCMHGGKFQVSSSPLPTGEKGVVRVTIGGVGRRDFCPSDFLFLCPAEKVFSSRGGQREEGGRSESLLLAPATLAGRVYCKGILVEERRDLVYGVDVNLPLHRDRRSISSQHGLRKCVGYLWADAVAHKDHGDDMLSRFVSTLQKHPRSLEAEAVTRFWIPMIEQFPYEVVYEFHEAVRAVQHHFRETYPAAFPCAGQEVAAAQESMSGPVVGCSAPYLEVLQCRTQDDPETDAHGQAQPFRALHQIQYDHFTDSAVPQANLEQYSDTIAEVRDRAQRALGVEATDIVFRSGAPLHMDVVQRGGTYYVNARYLDPDVVHEAIGGECATQQLQVVCRCSVCYIVSCLLAREFGKVGLMKVYCERDAFTQGRQQHQQEHEGHREKRMKR